MGRTRINPLEPDLWSLPPESPAPQSVTTGGWLEAIVEPLAWEAGKSESTGVVDTSAQTVWVILSQWSVAAQQPRLAFNPELGGEFTVFIEALRTELSVEIAEARKKPENKGKEPWYLSALKGWLKNKTNFDELYAEKNAPFWNFMKFQFSSPIGIAILNQRDFMGDVTGDLTQEILLRDQVIKRCNQIQQKELVADFDIAASLSPSFLNFLYRYADRFIGASLSISAFDIVEYFIWELGIYLPTEHAIWDAIKSRRQNDMLSYFKDLNSRNQPR
jgi:hypothetical protein